jgi:AAA domain/Zinc-binding domain of primase-helicase
VALREDPRVKAAGQAPILEIAQRAGAKLKRAGATSWAGPCPACGGTDRFAIDTQKGAFICRGFGGGNVITMTEHALGLSFPEALKFITGQDRPEPYRNGHDYSHSGQPEPPPWDDGLPHEPIDSLADPVDDTAQRDKERKRAIDEAEQKLRDAARRAGPKVIHQFVDEMGIVVYEKLRFEWKGVDGGKRKDFSSRRPARGADEWVYKLEGIERVPYRLPEVIDAIADNETIWICEGEGNADAVRALGLCGTATDCGAGVWPAELNRWFRGADVVILQDNDPQQIDKKTGKPRYHKDGRPVIPGKDHTQAIGRALLPYARSVRVLEFPELPPKGDVKDWAEAGGTAEQLIARVKAEARAWAPERPGTRYGALLWSELDKPGPEIEWLVDDLITVGDRSILGGESTSGKTFLALHMAMCVATGMDFFGKKVKQGLVVYQAGESAKGVKKRLRAWRKHFDIPYDRNVPFVLLTKKIDLFSPTGDVEGVIQELNAWRAFYPSDPLRLFTIDTLAKASIGAEENSAKEMGIVLENAAMIEEATGVHVQAVHHLNSSANKLRGSTAIYANLDQVISVTVNKETKIRTVTNFKQKEDEEGEGFQFELMSVKLGERDDGKWITSCVTLPVGEKAEIRAGKREDVGFYASPTEAAALRALLKAIELHGIPAPAELKVSPSVKVVTFREWLNQYLRTADHYSDDKEKQETAAKKAIQRATKSLVNYGVIVRDNPYVWWSGKPVRHIKETQPVSPSNVVFFKGKPIEASPDSIGDALGDGPGF